MELGNLAFGKSRGKYPVNRDWQNMFCEYLRDMGFDGYGDTDDAKLKEHELIIESEHDQSMRKFENDTFIVMPYYWGDDDYISELPNFVYKPTGFSISWYKYPLRDSYMNQDISLDELEGVMIECESSLGLITESRDELILKNRELGNLQQISDMLHEEMLKEIDDNGHSDLTLNLEGAVKGIERIIELNGIK